MPARIPGEEQDGARKVLPCLLLWYVRLAGVAGLCGRAGYGKRHPRGSCLWICPELGLGQVATQDSL